MVYKRVMIFGINRGSTKSIRMMWLPFLPFIPPRLLLFREKTANTNLILHVCIFICPFLFMSNGMTICEIPYFE